MPTTERSINDAIALVLRERRRLWAAPQRVRSENTRIFHDAGLQPDILITEPGTTPVVVETEVLPAITVEADARSRLGQALRDTGRQVFSSVAVRLPLALREHEGAALAQALRDDATKLEFVASQVVHRRMSPDGREPDGYLAQHRTFASCASR